MLFTTPEFFIFLVVVILLIELIRKQLWQQIILLIASYYFYWYSGSIHVLLLAFVTLTSYFCGYKLFKADTKKWKRIWLIIGIVIPLLVLGYFKYIDFGITQVNNVLGWFGVGLSVPLLEVLLPVGISFFTFQALSYVLDIYLKKIEHEPKFYRYALFIAFFPGLVAGPIVRASEFLPQLKSKIRITGTNLQIGVTLILWGLFKKMVIADNVGGYVNTIFANPAGFTSMQIIAATILFAVQIYCDFSGYANIAIGCAKIFGFTLPENFNMPYFAHNVQDYWNRWHMTLSRFIRDYVYYPMNYTLSKFNRRHIKEKKIRVKANELAVYLSLIVSMALCGLWHGASWTFVVWGVYYGLLLALYTYIVRYKKVGSNSKFLASNTGLVFKLLLCQIQVMFGFMIFRANSLSDLWICIQKIIFFDFNISIPMMIAIMFGISFIILAFIVMSYKPLAEWIKKMCTYDYIGLVSNMKMRYWLVFIVVMVAAVLLFAPPETPEFIYFAF